MTDEVVLTLPRERDFYDVAHLVVGGLAIRLNLTIEHLEDLQTALDGLLPAFDEDGDVTVAVRLDDSVLTARVGPFDDAKLRRQLDDDSGEAPLARVLAAVSDGYDVESEAPNAWVVLRKGVH